MEHFTRVFAIAIAIFIAPLNPSNAQDTPRSAPEPESRMMAPVEPTTSGTGEVLGENLAATYNTYENKINVTWEVLQQCLFGTALSIKLYEDNVLIYDHVYPATPIGGGWTGTWDRYHTPNTTHSYRLVRSASGTLCNVSKTFTATGKTDVIRKPVSLVVVNPDSSDRDITMGWSNGSSLVTYDFTIFRNGQEVLTTTAMSCTLQTVPDDHATWGVAVNTSYGQSQPAEAAGVTAPYVSPSDLGASIDTTVGYIRLNWECASDYATHFEITRGGIAIDTIPVSLKEYLDSSAVPRGAEYYQYTVRSYNSASGFMSVASNAANGRPAYMSASDGTEAGQVHVRWTQFPDTIRGSTWTDLRLYRDDVEIVPVSAGSIEKWDGSALSGKLHRYRLDVLDVSEVLLSITDYGFTPADGQVSGWVRTPTGAGVNQIEVRAYSASELSRRSFLADGSDDVVVAPPLDLVSNTVTITAWIKPEGAQNDGAIVVSTRGGSSAAGIHMMSDGELRYSWNGDEGASGWSSGLSVPDSVWSFVALIVAPDHATMILGETSAVNPLVHEVSGFDGPFTIGGDHFDPLRFFRGRIDEVNVWRSARTVGEVLGDRNHLLRGNETGLAATWNFNDEQESVAGDYAAGGNRHGEFRGGSGRIADSPPVWHYGLSRSDGQYSVYRINWEDGLDFTVKPSKAGHGFKGANFSADSTVLSFTELEHDHTGINFLDTTSIGISGAVLTAGDPACPVAGVRILVDSVFTGVTTDSAGEYSISVSEAGPYTVSVEYGTHGFLPADTAIDVHAPVSDLDFTDTTKSLLTGTVSGSCDNFLGIAGVRITSGSSGCLDTTVRTDTAGLYAITLPALEYVVRLASVAHPDSLMVLNYFHPDTVDLTERDSVVDYIYHPAPAIGVSEMPAVGCDPYDVPILAQEVTYDMRIDISESFGGLVCAVDSGTVTVSDFTGYAYRETTIAFTGGLVYYPLTAGYPNITGGGAHPYQKMVALRADAGPYSTHDTLWVFIRGQKPREFEFSTVSPEIPLMILRDPPGDQSYSYISSSTTSSVNIGFSFESSVGAGVFAKFRVGGAAEVPGIGTVGYWAGGEAEASVGVRSTIEGTQEVRISSTEMLRTSDLQAITGSEGDVYMGAALNILYAKTDILEYDSVSCAAIRDTGVVWNGDGFKTTYLYTESHIVHNVIPGLEHLAQILNASGDPLREDSAEILLNQAEVWRQVVAYNDSIRQHAVVVPAFPDNVSFSAGADLEEQATVSSTTTVSLGLNLFVNASVAASIGAKTGEANMVEGGVKIFAKLDLGTTLGESYAISNTVGFKLSDDDVAPPGDAFWVDIKGDPVYGTPVFELISGTSSCPWEHPTLPREGVGLSMDTYVLHDVPADGAAEFHLFLSNLGQNDETRTYELSLVQGSNPDGATISVGGVPLGDDRREYALGPNPDSALQATLHVERMPGSVYDYEGLQVRLASPCDGQFDTAVTFSVHFVKPCSDVRIARPVMNWILNHSGNQQMQIVLKDYDAANPELEQLTFEYRVMGTTDWNELFSYARALLPADSIGYSWDLSTLAEGAYELRASTFCTNGSYSTRVYAGMYDFTPPESFGAPEPADGVLDAGDEIGVAFTEPINCLSANDSAVTVLNLTRGAAVDVDILCNGEELVIAPADPGDFGLGDSILVTLDSLSDPFGNVNPQTVSWSFIVNVVMTATEDPGGPIPRDFVLEQSYPNPFNPSMTIRFGLPRSTDVALVIYDIAGREVMRVAEGRMTAGYHERTVSAGHLSSGIYFYRLQTPEYLSVRKMVLMK